MVMTMPPGRMQEPRKPTTFAINLEESWQCRWWAEYFGVTRAQLLAAILEVGVDAEDIRQALDRKS